MSVYIYTIRDRESGETLFTGGEYAASRFLGCGRSHLRKLAKTERLSNKKTFYSWAHIERSKCIMPQKCVDCGAELPGAAGMRRRCDACNTARRLEQQKGYTNKRKAVAPKSVVEIAQEQRKLQEPCDGCAYFGGEHYINRSCNYIFIEGHSRGCPPGADCTKRKEKQE